jgi:hypothetical protein
VRRLRFALLSALIAGSSAHAQQEEGPHCLSVRLIDAHSAVSGPVVRAVLAQPHEMVCGTDTTTMTLARGATIPRSIVLVAKAVAVEDTVKGDVMVIGGDLYLHPGSHIDGHAIAICGGVYASAQASVRYGVVIEPCEKILLKNDGPTVTVEYWPRGLAPLVGVRFPVFYGFRIPSYDRSDGLSASWGPNVNFDSLHLHLSPLVTYRSNLGHFDPSLAINWRFLTFLGERTTLTNDAWSRPGYYNSTATLGAGSDARNYYRSDHFSLLANKTYGDKQNNIAPYVSLNDEFDRSVGPDLHSRHYAWSLINPLDTSGVRRVNPPITQGRIISAIGGLRGLWTSPEGISANGSLGLEVPFTSPVPGTWVQTTIDADLKVPVIADHTFEFLTHDVATAGHASPAQRYAYVGGAPTIPTLFMLQEGGDDLVWLSASYLIPIHVFSIPLFGPPQVGPYYTTGAAGVRHLPHFTNNIGPQAIIGIFQFVVLFDPATGHHDFAVGAVLPTTPLF